VIKFVSLAIGVLIATYFLVRAIIKLPSRYERTPKNLTAWNALDKGIDPSTAEQRQP
jgi:hypothetical protein